jgi:hypothetical protein
LRPDGITEVVVDPQHVHRRRLRINVRRWLLSKVLPRNDGDRLDPAAQQQPVSDSPS